MKYTKYMRIKLEMAKLTEELMAIQPDVINEVIKHDGHIESDLGRISLVTRKNWSYSAIVDRLANKIKERKAIEEIKGIATYSESQSLMFKVTN